MPAQLAAAPPARAARAGREPRRSGWPRSRGRRIRSWRRCRAGWRSAPPGSRWARWPPPRWPPGPPPGSSRWCRPVAPSRAGPPPAGSSQPRNRQPGPAGDRGLPPGGAGDHPFRPAGGRAEHRGAIRRPDALAVTAGRRRERAGHERPAGRRTRRSAAGRRAAGTQVRQRRPGRGPYRVARGQARRLPGPGARRPSGRTGSRMTRPPTGPPAAGRTVTAASAPLGLGYTASDTARRRGRPVSWLSCRP